MSQRLEDLINMPITFYMYYHVSYTIYTTLSFCLSRIFSPLTYFTAIHYLSNSDTNPPSTPHDRTCWSSGRVLTWCVGGH